MSVIQKLFLCALVGGTSMAQASDTPECLSAELFHAYLGKNLPARSSPFVSLTGFGNVEPYHYIPNAEVDKSLAQTSLDEILDPVRGVNLERLNSDQMNQDQQERNDMLDFVNAHSSSSVVSAKPITIVIVPGIFGEFIKTKPFNEVISRSSKEGKAYLKEILKNRKNQVTSVKEALSDPYYDTGFSLEDNAEVVRKLEDVVNVSAVTDQQGKTLAKIVLLYPPLGSFETLGKVDEKAAIYNRRLQKYLHISHDENIVLLGYSRGIDFALSMASQAAADTNYADVLPRIKGIVSYSGVVFGSSLADDFNDPTSANHKLYVELKHLISADDTTLDEMSAEQRIEFMKTKDGEIHRLPKEEVLDKMSYAKKFSLAKATYFHNEEAFRALLPALQESQKGSPGVASEFKMFLKASPLALISSGAQMANILDLPIKLWDLTKFTEFNQHVERFKKLASEAMEGVIELSTQERTKWWRSHTIPTSIKYYALSAVMANPHSPSAYDKELYNSKRGFSNQFDDLNLITSQDQYTAYKATNGPLYLNDSQVSVPQSSFIPGVIRSLNQAQDPILADHLGILATHHWGITLEVVVPNLIDTKNPYPRESILKALASVVAVDLQKDLEVPGLSATCKAPQAQ